MTPVRYVALALCLIALHGCFDNSDNKANANKDNSKSSLQMQKPDADK